MGQTHPPLLLQDPASRVTTLPFGELATKHCWTARTVGKQNCAWRVHPVRDTKMQRFDCVHVRFHDVALCAVKSWRLGRLLSWAEG